MLVNVSVSQSPSTGVKKLFVFPALLTSLLVLTTNVTPSFAAEEVGKTVKIKNEVIASQGNRRLSPKDAVFEKEQITANANSHGEIRLTDNSKVLVGENSTVALDEFVVGSRGFDSGTFKVAKGAFRLVTGQSKKNAMKVVTPLATIGARGTIFDVYVNSAGVTRVILFKGAVEVCSASDCIVADNRCDIIEVNASELKALPFLRSGNRSAENNAYELIDRQARFQSGWRVPTAACSIRAALEKSPKIKKRDYDYGGGNDNNNIGRQRSGNSLTY